MCGCACLCVCLFVFAYVLFYPTMQAEGKVRKLTLGAQGRLKASSSQFTCQFQNALGTCSILTLLCVWTFLCV